ncbi:ferric reductase-like transmembrane domain-containing protein [Oceanicella sp. SM1341]|uniref:ferric reductase-like transmembrane domain-containing protein n=1 Tax=Oceanicella sp. SM1341 TaxID=1548889 RepID=UPI000E52BA2C|nr:ferric reductase-like transmembrane domain-containing protein [Oceanicella sp. SM1341]
MSPALRVVLAWGAAGVIAGLPVVLAAFSPLLGYRGGDYILGGFAGILCLAFLALQPLLAAGYLPGARAGRGRRWHRLLGGAIVLCVVLHVGGLWLASPPDVIDALLLVAPTPFSVWGVTAMWGVFATVLLVALRRRSGLGPAAWRLVHNALALLVVVATVLHALQIEGAMEAFSKAGLCLAALAATLVALADLRVLRPLRRARRG